jgi:hypothetical protein
MLFYTATNCNLQRGRALLRIRIQQYLSQDVKNFVHVLFFHKGAILGS